MGSDKGSDFVANFAFVPPSPPQIESVFDYPAFDSAEPIITSPPLPHTFSYTDSCYSPYSRHWEYSFHSTISSCRTFRIPWMSTNTWTTMRLMNHPPCWCSQTIPTTCHPTFLSTTIDLLFHSSIIVRRPATLVVQMKTTHILTILGAPDFIGSFKLSFSSHTVLTSTHLWSIS